MKSGDMQMAPKIADDPAADDLFDRIPELPSLTNRWTVCPKAAVVDAVREDGYRSRRCAAVITFPSVCFWPGGRDIDRYGLPGLRTTRYQIYRQTEARRNG